MKKTCAFALALMACLGVQAGESAGIAGMVVTNDTVDNNNFTYPRNIHTGYFPNDPAEAGILLAYVAYKKTGVHQPYVEITDSHGKYVDKCSFEPTTATKLPWTHTITCRWGGRHADGGLNFNLYNKFGGKQEKLGELFLAAKKAQ